MVSMKEIAKKCNVSVASVSKAMNGYSDISEETRKLILKTASEMGYLPNSSARTLKTKRSYNIGVMFVDEAASGLTHDYFNHVLESFKRTAEERGYDITFTSGRISGQKLSYYEHCRYRGVDGVVIACVDFYADEVQELIRSEIPVVTIDHVFDGNIAVVSNNSQGMEELVTYIYNQGHRRIAYIHGDNTSVTRMRLSGFYRTLQRLGVEIPDDYVKECPYRDADSAARVTGELLDLPNPPTCILYPDDYAAIGGINEIRERGLRIPEDISIAGYDGITIAKILEPKLTTLCQDTVAIGRIAAEKLIDLIENPKTTLIDRFTVDGTLFKGASVKRLLPLRENLYILLGVTIERKQESGFIYGLSVNCNIYYGNGRNSGVCSFRSNGGSGAQHGYFWCQCSGSGNSSGRRNDQGYCSGSNSSGCIQKSGVCTGVCAYFLHCVLYFLFQKRTFGGTQKRNL